MGYNVNMDEYDVSLLGEEERNEYTDILEKHERCNFSQSLEWAKVKSNWTNEIIIVRKNKKIIGSLSVLIRKIPIFGYLMYAPRGPVCDINDKKIMELINERNTKAGNEL